MSAPPRPFLFRFTLAILGTLLLIAVVFAGLGWIVVRQSGWITPALGNERTLRLRDWYVIFMMKLLPVDRDGDGVCDGSELLDSTDPRNPTDGFANVRYVSQPTVTAFCGERLTMRGVQWHWVGEWPWPKGFKAAVSADEPVLLPKNGTGRPTKGPLVLPVNERGEVEFDVLAETAFGDVRVTLSNAANGKKIRDPLSACFPGWRMPLLPTSSNESDLQLSAQNFERHVVPLSPSVSQPYANVVKQLIGKGDEDALSRIAPFGWSGAYLIEAAPEQGATIWKPVYLVDSPRGKRHAGSAWSSGTDLGAHFPGYTGPLKFRFVPVSSTPP